MHPAVERFRSGPPRDGEGDREVPGRVGVQHRPTPGRPANRGLHFGGDGTPQVAEFSGVELGVLLGTTTGAAERLLADVLDLRHRLPRTWAAVLSGQVEDWVARRVASLTRSLTAGQAAWVDAQVVDGLVGLPIGRALEVVEAKVIAADPAGHEARRTAEAARRYVAKGRRPNPAGLRTLVAQTTAGDIARLDAMIDHLATVMGRGGDADTHQVRRTKALALLANPALACVYLATQQTEQVEPPLESPGEPGEPGEPATSPSAVQLAVAFGQLLTRCGTQVLDRLRARTVLYVHLAEEALGSHSAAGTGAGVARVEGVGPIGLDQLREWLGTDRVVCRPVLDPAAMTAVDRYEAPGDLAEALTLLQPFEVFPYGTLESRHADKDHTEPYRHPDDLGPPGDPGPSGQTGLHNLGPLGRTHHRAKTFGGFSCYQPLPGLYLWRIPSGYWYRVDASGTHALGRQTPEILTQRHPGRATSSHPRASRSRVEIHFGDQITYALAT